MLLAEAALYVTVVRKVHHQAEMEVINNRREVKAFFTDNRIFIISTITLLCRS